MVLRRDGGLGFAEKPNDVALSGLYCRIERKARYWEEATCSVSDKDLAESLLRQGAADTIPLVESHYLGVVDRAKNAKLGIWGGVHETPKDWIKAHRAEADPKYCVVKGVKGETGLRFVTPMMFGYDKIEADARFCGVDDAMTAGYAPCFPTKAINGESAAPLSKP